MILHFNAINRRNDLVARASERSNRECRVNVSTLWPQPTRRFIADHATVGSRLFQDEHPVPDAPHPSNEEDETHQPHARETLESLHRLIGDDTRDEGADAGEEDVQQQRGDGDVTFLPTLTMASPCVFLMKSTTPDMSLVWGARRSVRRGVT